MRKPTQWRDHPLYNTWRMMIERCTNPKAINYKIYGGRGIKVCQRWLDGFGNFYADMGDKPAGWQLDRIDNDGNYSPSNCRWVTKIKQCRNLTKSRFVTVEGQSKTVSEWSEITGIPYNTIHSRLSRGLTGADAVFGRGQVRIIDMDNCP